MRDYSDCTGSDSSEDDGGRKHMRFTKISEIIITRPAAGPGFWLCCLMPLAFASGYLQGNPKCSPPATYEMLAIAAAGMCVESLCFFMYMFLDTALLLKLFISLVPGILTTCLYTSLLQQSWRFGIFWGFAVTFCYQNVYINVMRKLPLCFTYGEATILVQGLMLFLLNIILQLPTIWTLSIAADDFTQLNAIMMTALFYLLVTSWLLFAFKWLRQTIPFYVAMTALVAAVTCIPIGGNRLPILILFDFLLKDLSRLYIIVFFSILVCLTIITVWWQLSSTQKASTRVRKIFHLLIVLVYIPGLLYQCEFLYIASGVALALFTVIELFRILSIPPMENVLKNAFSSFSDEKDAGLLALTPFCLLIGCSLPIWMSPCPCNGNDSARLSLVSGILAIGVGDTAASVIGSTIGRIKWPNSNRSIEGTIAFITSVLLAVFALNIIGYIPMTAYGVLITVLATVITALIEALTDQIDNLVLPLVFYIVINFV